MIKAIGNIKGKLNNAVVHEYPELEDLEITPSQEEQNFKSSKYGYDNVKVKAIVGEELNITSSAEDQQYEGLYEKVNVKAIVGEELNIIPSMENQEYKGIYEKVNVNAIESEELTVTPSTEEQIQEGLYNKVTVAGDSNLVADNIKEGISIFGVEGTAKSGGEENAIIDDSLLPTNTYDEDTSLKKMITKIPNINISQWTNANKLFNGCRNLKEIPQLDTSNVTKMGSMFSGCAIITEIPQLDTSKVTTMSQMFYSCAKLSKIPQMNTNNVTNMSSMFSSCTSLTTIPQLDTSKVTTMANMFNSCSNLTEIPQLDTSNVTSMSQMFYACNKLLEIPQLDTSKVTTMQDTFWTVYELVNLGGFLNLGKGYTQKSNNYSSYKLSLLNCTKLTHESLMNVINNLYDLNLTYNVANGGKLYTQQLVLGSTNLAKLTAEEIAIATNKGWTVS